MTLFQAIFNDGHHRQLPRLVKGPFKYVCVKIPFSPRVRLTRSRYKTYAWENLKKSKPYAKNCPMKQAVIAPSMMYLLYPLSGTVEGYPKGQFIEDLVTEVSMSVPMIEAWH